MMANGVERFLDIAQREQILEKRGEAGIVK